MKKLLRLWQRALAHRETRRFFLLMLLTPFTFVLALGVLLPALSALNEPAFEPADEAVELAALPPEERAAQRRLLALVDSLKVAEAFLKNRLEMAAQDEITLAVDLADSVLFLEIQGVTVRQVPVARYRLSRALERARRQHRLTQWLAQPFTLERTDATVPRAPVRVVTAPRDTTEAQARPPQEIPVETSPTHFALHFDRGLSIRVDQPASPTGFFKKALFSLKERTRTAGRSAGRLARGQAPEHALWIWLELAPEDAKAIYRALPDDARLALRL